MYCRWLFSITVRYLFSEEQKTPQNDQSQADSFATPLLKKKLLSTNACAGSEEKPGFVPPGFSRNVCLALPGHGPCIASTGHVWIREAAQKGARHNAVLPLTLHRVLEARVQ